MSDDVCPKCLRPRLLPGMTGAGCARELLGGDAGDCHRATVARAERAEAERDVLRAQRDTARADADDAMRQVVALQARADYEADQRQHAEDGRP